MYKTQYHLLIPFLLLFIGGNLQAQKEKYRELLDTLSVLNGGTKIVVPGDIFKSISKTKLKSYYASRFGIGKLECVNGFKAKDGTRLLFFHTNIKYDNLNDDGIAMSKLIYQFTDKVTDHFWIQSGYKNLNESYFYYVKLQCGEGRVQRYIEFIFYDLKGRLAVVILTRPALQMPRWHDFMDKAQNLVASIDTNAANQEGILLSVNFKPECSVK